MTPADVLLVRLLGAGGKPTLATLRKFLDPLFAEPPSDDAWTAAVNALSTAGYTDAKAKLTDAGRARAYEVLGIPESDKKPTWAAVQKLLIERALGLTGADAKTAHNEGKLTLHLLEREKGLKGKTLDVIVTAAAMAELGLPAKLPDIQKHAKERLIGRDDYRTKAALNKAVAEKLLGYKPDLKAIHRSALHQLTRREPLVVVLPEAPHPLERFADVVLAAVRSCPTGRVGDNKVLISHAWRYASPDLRDMDLPTFRKYLADAHTRRFLTLSRLDLVQEFDPADLQASATPVLGTAFHTILLEPAP